MIINFVLVSNGGRCISHEVLPVSRLGKCDDVTNTFGLAEDCDQAVQAQSDPAVRRTPAGQSLEQVAQVGCVFSEDLLQDKLLKVGVVYTDRTAADFESVQNKVIVKAADFERIAVNEVDVIRVRLSERVMGRLEAGGALAFGRKEKWKVLDPQKPKKQISG
jgi:hypothetical protein